MSVPALECRDFSFFYAKRPVLQKINFQLGRGEWLSIVGPNGAGKSTLLKNLLRLVSGGKSTGEILVWGRPISQYGQRELARKLAYVPQAGAPVPAFTVREFVNFSRFPYGWGESARRVKQCGCVERALQVTDTVHLASTRLDRLSGGQRQRVYLAAALAQGTGILLLDEPASFLDPRHTQDINDMLARLHLEQDITVLIVTHDLNLPFAMGGKALALKAGQQEFFGPAAQLRGILDRVFDYEFCYLAHPKTQKTLVIA